jgi:hypothetical protein
MIAARGCRAQINARVNRIRRVLKWAVSVNLLTVEAHQRLLTVT